MATWAIFLNGPVGAGKTTLGQALAKRLHAGFIDGDRFSDPDRPWYCSSLKASRAIVQNGLDGLRQSPIIMMAYPLRCINWIYFVRTFERAGVTPRVVTLKASFASTVDVGRGRAFSRDERARIWVMIEEGYGRRPFSNLILDTGTGSFAETLERLEHETRRMMSP